MKKEFNFNKIWWDEVDGKKTNGLTLDNSNLQDIS
jgi:hypothetical protein